MSTMNTKLKVVVLALGLGAATLAAAQSPGQAQTFTNEIQQWQALSGTGTYTFHTPPTLQRLSVAMRTCVTPSLTRLVMPRPGTVEPRAARSPTAASFSPYMSRPSSAGSRGVRP